MDFDIALTDEVNLIVYDFEILEVGRSNIEGMA